MAGSDCKTCVGVPELGNVLERENRVPEHEQQTSVLDWGVLTKS